MAKWRVLDGSFFGRDKLRAKVGMVSERDGLGGRQFLAAKSA